MQLQPEFYLHVTGGLAADSARLMARIALHLGHDSQAYPVSLAEIMELSNLGGLPETCGFNEFFVVDYLRAAIMGDAEPWEPYQVEALKRAAEFDPNRGTSTIL